jgi:hypothetical protein
MEYEKKFPSFDHRRLELLFTVPDELITAPDGGFVLGPYVKTNDCYNASYKEKI